MQRRTERRNFTTEELSDLPDKHAARRDPSLIVERNVVRPIEMPPFERVTNRVEVVFEAAEPALATNDPLT